MNHGTPSFGSQDDEVQVVNVLYINEGQQYQYQQQQQQAVVHELINPAAAAAEAQQQQQQVEVEEEVPAAYIEGEIISWIESFNNQQQQGATPVEEEEGLDFWMIGTDELPHQAEAEPPHLRAHQVDPPIFTDPPAEATSVAAAVQEEAASQTKVKEQEDAGTSSSIRPKRARRARRENHNQSERRRRDRINDRMEQLRNIVPGCKKRDRASVLEETCNYLKSLQNRVKMLSLGGNRGAGAGEGTSTGTGIGMNPPPMVLVPVPVPGYTLQNPANNTAALWPTAVARNMHGQSFMCFYPLPAENIATLQPSPVSTTNSLET